MTDLQRSILAISSALVVLLIALILRSSGDHAEKVRPVVARLEFDPSRAAKKAKRLAAGFPERAMGTQGSREAADWIESQLARAGLKTERQEFEAWLAGGRVKGVNVVGIDRGIRDGIVVIIAHYDIPFHVREGAMDDASGVGVLLELARVFGRKKQKKTLVFVASDGEEWGMLGARHFVRTHPAPGRIRAAVSLDSVPLEHPEKIFLRGEGQFRGRVPLWLRLLAEDCVVKAGGEPAADDTFAQFVSRAVNISSTDQGPFLRAGIPGIDLGGSLSNSPLARDVYHTVRDTSENLRPELFGVYGNAAELMVHTLDALDYSTDNNPLYLRTGKRTYVGRSGVRAMQIMLFVPLLLATCFQYYNLRTREDFLRSALTEVGSLLLFLLPWAVALATLYLLVWKNVIPRYELYPATPLDPFLSEPNWTALSVVGAAFLAAWASVFWGRRSLSLSWRVDFACSKAVCLDFLLTLAVISLFLNGFAAGIFLAPAALLWIWVDTGRNPMRICVNAALTLGAVIPLVLLTVALSRDLMLGPYVLWYFALGAGYRFFSPITVLIAVAAATAGVRLLRQSFVEADAAADHTEKAERPEEEGQ